MGKEKTPTPEEILKEHWQKLQTSLSVIYDPMSPKAVEYFTQAMQEYRALSIREVIEEVKCVHTVQAVIEILNRKIQE